jgi:hypothetical protein
MCTCCRISSAPPIGRTFGAAAAGGGKRALTEKLHRQQQQLRDGFTSRDETIRQLNALLARHPPGEGTSANRESGQDDAASAGEETSRNVIADLNRKLGQETTRRERLEQRLSAMSATMKKTAEALQTAQGRAGRFAPRDRVARGSHCRGAAARGWRRRGRAGACGPDDPVCRRAGPIRSRS